MGGEADSSLVLAIHLTVRVLVLSMHYQSKPLLAKIYLCCS